MVFLDLAAKNILKSEKIRFAIVGGINTAVDFIVLLALSVLVGVPVVFANIVSTSCAMTVSFVLNKRAVFGNTDRRNKRQVISFLAVTLSGIWLVQSLVIAVVFKGLMSLSSQYDSAVLLIAAKLFATIISLIWNYVGYSKFVFRKGTA